MKYLIPLCLALSIGAKGQAIHFKSILVDTHNDAVSACIEKNVSLDQDLTGINHSDLKRFKEGGVDYQLFSIWCDGEKVNPYAWAMREMDTIDAVAARNPDKMVVAKSWKQIEQALKEGMPQKPMRENFTSEEAFEEHYGYWMSHYGRVLALRQQIRNEEKKQK